MQSAIAIILVIGVLVAFHEFGHFIVARMLGIGVHTFSIGFGPKLLARRWGSTEYRLSAIPLGGYVHLVGESDEEEVLPEFPPEASFSQRPAWHRMLVIAAGPVFNLILAAFIYWGLAWGHGQVQTLPTVGQVRAESPAAVAGLSAGDRLVAIGDSEIVYWPDIPRAIQAHGGKPVTITVDRSGEKLKFTLTPEIIEDTTIFGEEVERYVIGIHAAGDTVTLPLSGTSALTAGVRQTWNMIALTGEGFLKLFQRVVPLEEVGGPIMIAQLVSQQAEQGVSNLLALTAFISINLALLNLLPVPVLDGGHLLFLLIEIIVRRPVNPRVMEFSTKIGLGLLLSLMVLATYNDIARNDWQIIRSIWPF